VLSQIGEVTLELVKEKKETVFQDEWLEDFFKLGGDLKLMECLDLTKQSSSYVVDFFQSLFVYGGRDIDEFAAAQRGKLNEVDRFIYDYNQLFTSAIVQYFKAAKEEKNKGNEEEIAVKKM